MRQRLAVLVVLMVTGGTAAVAGADGLDASWVSAVDTTAVASPPEVFPQDGPFDDVAVSPNGSVIAVSQYMMLGVITGGRLTMTEIPATFVSVGDDVIVASGVNVVDALPDTFQLSVMTLEGQLLSRQIFEPPDGWSWQDRDVLGDVAVWGDSVLIDHFGVVELRPLSDLTQVTEVLSQQTDRIRLAAEPGRGLVGLFHDLDDSQHSVEVTVQVLDPSLSIASRLGPLELGSYGGQTIATAPDGGVFINDYDDGDGLPVIISEYDAEGGLVEQIEALPDFYWWGAIDSDGCGTVTGVSAMAGDGDYDIYQGVRWQSDSRDPGCFVDSLANTFSEDIAWLGRHEITAGCNPPAGDWFCPNDYVTRGQMAAFLVRALDLTDNLDDPFTDDDSSIFEADIEKLAAAGITKGCNPPTNTLFCPNDFVTRGQMAAFLVRALRYTDDGGGDLFIDDDGSVFEADIDRLGTARVTKGCNPPTNDRFCPNDFVTRGQMAAFLVRALGYTNPGTGDSFTDDDDSVFETDIDRRGTAGVTMGCNPPTNNLFCPDSYVTRAHMAALLHRALG